MGHYKYASDEEAKKAIQQQRKNWIEKYGVENYHALMRKQSLICYYRNKELHKNDPKPLDRRPRGRPRGSTIKEPKIKIPNIKKSELIDKIKHLEELLKNKL